MLYVNQILLHHCPMSVRELNMSRIRDDNNPKISKLHSIQYVSENVLSSRLNSPNYVSFIVCMKEWKVKYRKSEWAHTHEIKWQTNASFFRMREQLGAAHFLSDKPRLSLLTYALNNTYICLGVMCMHTGLLSVPTSAFNRYQLFRLFFFNK